MINRERHTMKETEIVQLAQQGDTLAFRQLFEDNKRKVFTLAIAKTDEDVKAQEQAIFWLGQKDDEAALKFFEEILLKKK